MRIAGLVVLGYVALVFQGAVGGVGARIAPDLVAVFATYFALSCSERIGGAALGAFAVGYLADILGGTPVGFYAALGASSCVFIHVVSRRLLVRGRAMVMVTTALAAVFAFVVGIALRAHLGMLPSGSVGAGVGLVSALLTGIVAVPLFGLCRRVDSVFLHPNVRFPFEA